jgi:hypothetical protein
VRHFRPPSLAAACLAWLTCAAAAQPPPPPGPPLSPDKDAPIQCEFRVFDGEEEVTTDTSIRMFPTGTREGGLEVTTVEGRRMLQVAPAIYDAQVVRLKQGQVSNIRWSERLVVMRYPDENGRHLEVINFRPRFGALQIVSPDGGEFDVAAFEPGTREAAERRQTGRIVKGMGYQLLVAQAGRYDVRIRKADAAERWFLEIEVPADRTRLKTTDGS